MSMNSTLLKDNHRVYNIVLQLIAPILFLMVMLILYPYLDRLQFNGDEGYNVMKAMLNCNGYSLYKEIWNDQPPLFTHALSVVFRIFGFKVTVGRFFVLIMSCMLLWGAWRFLQQVGGNIYAFSGVFLIALLPNYTRLSISVMIGLPSLALSVVSLSALALWHQRRKYIWLILSAVTLSLSISTKVFTGCLVPVFIIGILAAELFNKEIKTWKARFRPVTLWVLVFTFVTFIILFFFVGLDNMSQLWENHLLARGLSEYNKLSPNIGQDVPKGFMLLAFIGILLTVRKKRWIILYVIAWLGIAYFTLRNHAPVWWHQKLLFTIPIAFLAACAIGEVIKWIPKFFRSKNILSVRGLIIIIVAILAIASVKNQTFRIVWKMKKRACPTTKTKNDYKFLSKMKEYASKTKWVITDRPIYAFRAGLSVPPYLAVISKKRLNTNVLTYDKIFKILRDLKPKQVFLTYKGYPDYMIAYLEENYRLVHSKSRKKLYILKETINLPLEGYASVNGATTGGEGGEKVTVSTLSGLKKYAAANSPYIIYVSGKICGDDAVTVNSNKSIIGIGPIAHLEGIGLTVNNGVSNIIIQNMMISKVKATGEKDAIRIVDGAHHIWIDHCELFSDRDHEKDFYDGLIDITRESDYITISWCFFHDHFKTILIGDSDNATNDRGKLKVTLHHNYFYNISSRTPSLRFGTGHVYNNYFKNVRGAISSRMGACVRVEKNYFENVKYPFRTNQSPISGNIQLQNNKLTDSGTSKTLPACNLDLPYNYESTMHRTSDVPMNAGVYMTAKE